MSNPSNRELDAKVIALDKKRRGFTLYRDLELEAHKEWLVQNLLGAGEASTIYGKPGDGKSVLAEDLALHIAAGKQWHGRRVKKGGVIYIALERRKLVERRAIAFRKRHQLPDLPFAIIGGVHDFRDYRTVGNLIVLVHEIEGATGEAITLIIVDTLSRALCGGDENSSKDIGALINATSRLQGETAAHITWIHHMPHESERLRGHGALLGALDTTIHVAKHTDGTRMASVIKANDSEEGEKVVFTLESVTISASADDNQTTAPIVLAVDPRSIKSNDNRWTKGLRLVQESIIAALNDCRAVEHHVANDGPLVKAVFIDDARKFHKRLYMHGGDGDRAEAERKAWQRNIKDARNRTLIASGINDGREIVWLTT